MKSVTVYGLKKGMFSLLEIIRAKEGGVVIPPMAVGIDTNNYPYFITAWQPNKEDIEAINHGKPIFLKTLCKQLPPMALFTLDENNQGNF